MHFGINTFLFTSPFTDQSTALFAQFKKWGFDSVEIAIEDRTHIDASLVKKALDQHGLICGTVCGAFGPGRDLRGTREEQATSLKYIRDLIDAMSVLGAHTLVGPVYSAVGRANPESEKDRKSQWKTVVKNLKAVARYAEQQGKFIAVEPLNRYETDFLNTCEQATRLLDDVDSPALRIHLDTYHMNIEEKDSAQAIRRAGKRLGHLHACGCDRGTPGKDHIDWKSIAAALKSIGYKKDVVIESFTPEVKVIARAASIWRTVETRMDRIPADGLKFLRRTLK